ncbi:MAG: hypothetical protein M1828_005468 [Chrysothrix sp. TS-e1954]|nr:MAG: hypothetical protein M1828_005468 [Chrysothrix sp. TS-e1954]
MAPSTPSPDSVEKDPEAAPNSTRQSRNLSFARRSSKAREAGYQNEDPFAGEESGEIQYRTMAWWQASAIMIAETISLGILSLPSVLDTVGLAPGIILIIGLGVLATYTGYVLGQFKLAGTLTRYPYIHTFADAGEVLFSPIGLGAFGREFFGIAQVIFLVFSMGSHVLTWTIMMNTITTHATCTIVWGIIGMLIFIAFDTPRTMKNLSYYSIASFISILTAVLITMIALGVSPPPGAGPVKATEKAQFYTAFNSVSNIVFAYAGHVSFFSFISEFKRPEEWPKALFLLQGADTVLYIVAAIVIYYYATDQVQSPALGTTGDLVKKVAYGMAIPTIIIAGVVYGHVSSKYIFVRLFRGTPHLSSRSLLATSTWLSIVFTLWLLAWIIAESIPVFNDLLSLISALFASWFTYGLSGVFWLFMNYRTGWFSNGPRKAALSVLNMGLVGMGTAICGIGLYASGKSIKADSGQGASWSCADNSKSSA